MLLNEYIDKYGAANCAEKFGVTVGCISHWRNGIRLPRPKQALIIVEKSCGELTWQDIYQPPSLDKEAA